MRGDVSSVGSDQPLFPAAASFFHPADENLGLVDGRVEGGKVKVTATKSGESDLENAARPIGRNQIGRLDRLRNMKRLRALQSCPV